MLDLINSDDEKSKILNDYDASMRNYDSSVSIMTGYELDSRVLIPGRGKLLFCSPRCPIGSGSHSASHPNGNGCSLLAGGFLGCKLDHYPPSSAEVQKGGAITPFSYKFS